MLFLFVKQKEREGKGNQKEIEWKEYGVSMYVEKYHPFSNYNKKIVFVTKVFGD